MEKQENEKIDFKVNFSEIINSNKAIILFILYIIFSITLFYVLEDTNDEGVNFGTFGDYFGGVLNPILGFISFIAILWTVALQRHSIKLQKDELKATREELEKSRAAQELQAKLFEQQQFETTFFNMLELLHKYSKPEISQNGTHKTWTDQFDLILFSLLNHIKQYTDNKEENEKNKYEYIVKANLDKKAFLMVIGSYHKLFINNNHQIYYPYQELKEMIEKYSLFDFIPKVELTNKFVETKSRYSGSNLRQHTYRDDTAYKSILKYFKLSAFGNNYYLLADRIDLEENPNELAKYATSPYKVVRKAIAKNEYTAKETLILLSQDKEEEVRQAAINNENLKIKV